MTYKSFKFYTISVVLLVALSGEIIVSVNKLSLQSSDNLSSAAKPSVADEAQIWDRLRSDMRLPTYEHNKAVQAQIRWYMHHQDYLHHIISSSAPYIYYIYQQVKKRNLPVELVLLPVIESEYNPFTTSSVGASGLWQLMPDTARGFGVRQDWSFDGRRDVYASTRAALDYLAYLQSYFGGDWLLATAAYDAGEGRVQSAIRHNATHDKGTSFWSLDLPMETRAYVPRLLALASIIKDPDRYGIKLPLISDKPYLGQVNVAASITLSEAAKLAELAPKEFKRLNPGYKSGLRIPKRPYKLLLPIKHIALFNQRLAARAVEEGRTIVERCSRHRKRRYVWAQGKAHASVLAACSNKTKLFALNGIQS